MFTLSSYWLTSVVVSVVVATCVAYPYKNFHGVRENLDPKDVRNLDGLDISRPEVIPADKQDFRSSDTTLGRVQSNGDGDFVDEVEINDGGGLNAVQFINWCYDDIGVIECDVLYPSLIQNINNYFGRVREFLTDNKNMKDLALKLKNIDDYIKPSKYYKDFNKEQTVEAYKVKSKGEHKIKETLNSAKSKKLDKSLNLDGLGGGHLLRDISHEEDRDLDSLGGGNLLRSVLSERIRDLDSLGGGHLLRRLYGKQIRDLDSLGGGNLLRSLYGKQIRDLDSLGGGNLLRSMSQEGDRDLDSLGGGHLLRSVLSEHIRDFDSLGGGHLLRSLYGKQIRDLDSLGGGNLLRNLSHDNFVRSVSELN